MDDATPAWKTLAKAWHLRLAGELAPGETVFAWFEPDLDHRLHYAQGLVVLTDRRVLAVDEAAGASLQSWSLEPGVRLRVKELGGVGTLELLNAQERLAHWRFTAARSRAAHHFVQRLLSPPDGSRPTVVSEEAGTTCPSCGAVLPPDVLDCPTCAPAAAPTMSSLFRLAKYAVAHKGMVVLGLILATCSTAASMVPIYLSIPLFNEVLIPHQAKQTPIDFKQVAFYLSGLAGAAVLAWLLGWGRTYVLAWVSERIAGDLRVHAYSHLQKLSLEFFGGKRTGDLIARLSSDTDRICFFLSVNGLEFVSDMLMICMTAGVLVYLNPWLALFSLIPFPFIGFLVHRVRERLKYGFQHGGRAWSEMTSVLADTIPGVRVVKAFAQERREVARFSRANDHVLSANDRVNSTWSFFGPVISLSTEAGLLVIWAFSVWYIAQDIIDVGILIGFMWFIQKLYNRLDALSRIAAATQRAAASAQRVFEILDRQPSVAEPSRPVQIGKLRGQIEMRHVGFKYGSRTVLDDINLTIQPGEMIGLVGPSGSGKSTLVNLVCRFYDVSEGSILVDGTDIRSFAVGDYRRHIGLVLQEPFLFFGTIAENIAYGRPEASRAEIVAAAKAARAHEFILRLADGYDSLVGERGQSLSGGERQRISIARALLIDPVILILDEATSSVDTQTEREIQEALDNLIQGRTTIAIAHRLSTLRRADRLVVLERGKIVEEGEHDELLKSPGPFSRLHQAQLELAGVLPESSTAPEPNALSEANQRITND